MKLLTLLMTLLLFESVLTAQLPVVRRGSPTREATAPQTAKSSLPIRRVILYSNGVGYFERRGTVAGHTQVSLTFKQSEIDDVLKSIVVIDLGKGRISVRYSTSTPLSSRLADIPFLIPPSTENDAGGGLAGVLRQLQGARVGLTTGNRTASGAILTVEERTSQIDANKPPVTTRRVVLASDTGELASFDLSEVRALRLLDDGARQGVMEFAHISGLARRRDARTIVVTSDGAGPRELVVNYTVPTPIWKTTYRVVLDDSDKPFFQGWGVVDNLSDEDWDAISLTLVSGSPVSFIQPVQPPLYRYRPVVPIPTDLKLTPQLYEPAEGVIGGVPGGGPGGVIGSVLSSGSAGAIGSGSGSEIGPGQGGGVGGGPYSVGANPALPPRATLSDVIVTEESGVTVSAMGSEVGDLFEYKIAHPVTIGRQQSALIPILQTRMEGERVSIYRDSADKDRPMGGLRLKNTSALTLEGGSLTVIEGDGYAGEALIERVKPGEERFISYALDLGTLVTARSKGAQEPAFLVRQVNGTFQAHYYETEVRTYTLTNQTDRPRVVFVEHPARAGWKLSGETPQPTQKTASAHRFRVELGPRATVQLPVSERRALMTTYALTNLTPHDIELYISSRTLDEPTRTALEKILDLKNQIAAVEGRLASINQEMAEISKDQQRLRENIQALEKTHDARQLILRYVAKADRQETRVEQLTQEHHTASGERDRLQGALDATFRSLDRRLSADASESGSR